MRKWNLLADRDSVAIVPLMFYLNLKKASHASEDSVFFFNHMGRKDESAEEVK